MAGNGALVGKYILDQSWDQEAERLRRLEQWADPVTIDHLKRIGVGAGWRCLEVGAGGGSVARYLSTLVSPAGSVLAIDLDTQLFERDASEVLEVRRLDFMTEDLPTGFDFIHARLVVGHQTDRVNALRRLAAALRPGGIMLIEENDIIWTELPAWPVHNDPMLSDLMNRVWKALLPLLKLRGYDGHCGRYLAAELLTAGLTEVRGEARASIDPSAAVFGALTVARFRDVLVASGELTREEMDHFHERSLSGELLVSSPLQVSVWGTRPI